MPVGEDVWEPEPSNAEVTKLDPEDVLTSEQAGKLLAPFIKPLPNYDDFVLGKKGFRDRLTISTTAGHGQCVAA